MTGPTAPSPQQRPERMVALALVTGGLMTLGVAIYLATIEPVLAVIGLLAIVDFALAWAFATGRIGPAAQRRRAAEASGDAAAIATEDPGYNPYARED